MNEHLQLPEIVFGTSGLGNLYKALPQELKDDIIKECVKHSPGRVFFDSAGKYGAGLALESLGKGLKASGVSPDKVMISNKLGWYRTELTTPEPTFEPGVWKDLQYDAVQQISYDGILACYEQGNSLLGDYKAEWVSVHDPDEYLAAAKTEQEKAERFSDILDAYRALNDLKKDGQVKAIGVGSKDWKIIREISGVVALDWVMIANSMTIHSHPADLVAFMKKLEEKGVAIINSAVFNGGFLTGLDYYNYQPVSRETNPALYQWRESFYEICAASDIRPEAACVAFALRAPGVKSVALSTTNPNRVEANAGMGRVVIPDNFWRILVTNNLIDADYAESFLY